MSNNMDSLLYYVVFLALLVFAPVSGVRFRYTSYRYTYYYSGYRYTYYYYYAGSSYSTGTAGIVIGCLIIVGGIIACIVSFCILCRRRRRQAEGRLISPAVFSPNTTSATGAVVLPGNSTQTLAIGAHSDDNAVKPLDESYPNQQNGGNYQSGNPGLQGQESGASPPSYDMVVGGPSAASTSTSGTSGASSSTPDL